MAKQKYITLKSFPKDKVEIFDETVNKLYLFCVGNRNVCVRKDGDVVFDNSWKRSVKTQAQKKHLKDFLGGMYIAEMEKEIKSGVFHLANLNINEENRLHN